MAAPSLEPGFDLETAMRSNELVRLATLSTLLAAGGLLAALATAEPVETVTVEAAREVRVGQTTTGIPISEIMIRTRVSYADLDLTTDAGVKELESRIQSAARNACREMNVRVPAEGSSETDCVTEAAAGAMAEAKKIIASKRSAAK
jgi:UrcA family protein